MPAKARSPAPGRRSGAPSGGGTSTSMKRRQVEELLELPPLSSLPDGETEYFIGGWSALDHLYVALTAITQRINAPPSSGGLGEGDTSTASGACTSSSSPYNTTTVSNLSTEMEEAYLLAGAASSIVDSALLEDRAILRRLLEVEEAVFKGKNAPRFTAPSGGDSTINQGDDEGANNASSSSPTHRIVVLPTTESQQKETVDGAGEGASDVAHIAWVTHGLVISGLLPSQSLDGATAFDARIQASSGGAGGGLTEEEEEGAERQQEDGEDDGEENEVGMDADNKGAYAVKFRAADAKGDDDGEDEDIPAEEDEGGEEDGGGDAGAGTAVEHDTAIAFVLASKRSEQRRVKARGEGRAAVTAAATGSKIPAVVRRAMVVDPDNSVQVPGPLTFQGLRPRITVAAAEITPEAVYAAAGLPPPNAGGKAKRRTDEEKAREVAAEQKLVEEAAAQASAEEQRLSQYADPSRWPSIVVSRLAFVSPKESSPLPIVTVKGAHVHFINCHFTGGNGVNGVGGGGGSSSLCAVTAYCKVAFTRCTFVAPRASAIYAFPSANVFVSECVFTAAQQPCRFFSSAGTDNTSTTTDSLDTYIFASPTTIAATMPTTTKSTQHQSVGVHGDGAKVTIRSSHFEGLDVAVLMRGMYKPPPTVAGGADGAGEGEGGSGQYGMGTEANEEGHRVVRPKPAHTIITENTFLGNACAMCFVDARRTAAIKNACVGNTRYDLQCMGTRCTPQILRCNLQGRVQISEGSAPFMHSNHLASVPVDANSAKSSIYNPTY